MQKERGIALYLTIIVMALLLAMVFGLGSGLVGQVKFLREVGHSMVTLYAAEAGLESMLYQDIQGEDITVCDGTGPAFCEVTFPNGASYEILVQLPGAECAADAYCVESTGSFNQSARALRIIVDSIGFGCIDQVDVMLVLDKSSSITPIQLGQLKTAAKAFVDVLAPSVEEPDDNTPHIGQVSFSEVPADLDQHLTASSTLLYAAIDAIVIVDDTFMGSALTTAQQELDNPGDGHDRDDSESPDFMVFITDGRPDDSEASVKLIADAVKAAGTEIFVVGVGNGVNDDFLRDDIASSPTNYFDIDPEDGGYGALEAALEELATCG